MATMTIYPYLLGSTWVFDDARAGLKEEAFVLGMSEMISRVVAAKGIPHAEAGFALTFSSEPFDHDAVLDWISSDEAAAAVGRPSAGAQGLGNWYRGTVAGEEMTGWLCPALFCYFEHAPPRIYARAEPLPAGVDPIWRVSPGDPRARRYVGPPV